MYDSNSFNWYRSQRSTIEIYQKIKKQKQWKEKHLFYLNIKLTSCSLLLFFLRGYTYSYVWYLFNILFGFVLESLLSYTRIYF